MRRLPLALVLLLLAPTVAAQVYKWTDSHGTVHYSESPPPQGTQYKRITNLGTAAPSQPAPPPRENAQPPHEASADTAAPMEDTPENRARLCSSLKSNLDLLKGSGPVVMEQDGKQVALNEDQRSQQIAQAQKQYDQFCSQ